MLRCLTIRCLVAWHIDDGRCPVRFSPSAFPRIVGTRCAWTDPFHLGSFLCGTASQRPVKSQQAKKTRSLTHLILLAIMAR